MLSVCLCLCVLSSAFVLFSVLPSGSGGATPGGARSNDLAGRSTALAPALPIALLCFGNSANKK